MQANATDLPLRGNYFAEADYLSQDLAAGTLTNRAGARFVALPDDLMVSRCNTRAEGLGDRAAEVLTATGRDWGRRAAGQYAEELGAHHGTPLPEQPLALFAADLTAAFLHHGWGRFRFDLSRYARGLLVVDVEAPFLGSVVRPAGRPVESLLAGFLAGMFTHFAGVDLGCVQTECRAAGATRSRFVLTVPKRLAAVAGWPESGRGHDEIVAELERSTV